MNNRLFDHIDLRVRDRVVAQKFYRQLLPALGFSGKESEGEWMTWQAPGDGPVAFFGFTEDPAHQPNDNRIVFWAETRAEVDRLAELVRQAGGQNIEGPELCREYSPGYYALFFEDPSGNKLEICCRQSLSA